MKQATAARLLERVHRNQQQKKQNKVELRRRETKGREGDGTGNNLARSTQRKQTSIPVMPTMRGKFKWTNKLARTNKRSPWHRVLSCQSDGYNVCPKVGCQLWLWQTPSLLRKLHLLEAWERKHRVALMRSPWPSPNWYPGTWTLMCFHHSPSLCLSFLAFLLFHLGQV